MYKGHVNYYNTINKSNIEVFNNKINEEKGVNNPDKIKIAKLEEAKMLCGLFGNEFKTKNIIPW